MIPLRPATKISIIYLVAALLWIYLSDTIMLMIFTFDSPHQQMIYSIVKGFLYIFITTFLLYELIRAFYRKIDDRIDELQEKQQELSALQKITITGLWDLSFENNKVNWSTVSKEIFEVAPDFDPQPESLINYLSESVDGIEIMKMLETSSSGGNQFDIVLPIITARGNEKWIRVTGNPIMKNGKCIKISGSFQDISGTKKIEKKLIQLNRLYDFILQINELMVRTQDTDILFQEICRIAVSVGQFKMAWIGKLDEVTKIVSPVAEEATENGYLEKTLIIADGTKPEGRGPTGLAASEGRYFVCNDIESDPKMKPWRENALKCGYKSSIALPIMKFGKVFGTFTLYAGISYYFDEKEIELLKDATSAISFVLENIEKEQQRKNAEINLAESEEKYRRIVETSNEGIWIIDKNNTTTFVNDRMSQILGYTNSEMMGKHLFDFTDKEWAIVAKRNIEKRKSGVSEIFDFKYVKKDGQSIWATVSTVPMYIDGEYSGSLAMVTDITDRKEADQKVLEALERYDSVTKATRDTIFDWDIKNNTIQFNQGINKTFGYTAENTGSTIEWTINNIHPNDIDKFTEVFDTKILKKNQVIRAEGRFRCADGTYKDVVVRGILKYSNDDEPLRIIGSMQDVSSLRQQEFLIEKAVNDTQERERQQIGMELHDNVNQILSVSLLYLGKLKETVAGTDKENKDFESIDHFIREAINEIRKLSHRLAPVSIKDVALKFVFEDLIETVNANNRFKVNLKMATAENNIMPAEMKINLYRILQEQLNNIEKYSEATEVDISLTEDATFLRFRIADNGKGFNPKNHTKGIGLENIRRRTKLLSGDLEIKSAPGEGCEIMVEIPLEYLSTGQVADTGA